MGDIKEYAILVVDDDEPIVKNMRRVLRRKGFNKVVSALNAEQAIGLLESSAEQFFLIMSDQRMPGMQGSEFLEKSILLSPESRRILITG
ncbi:MAG: response regulator, partial [Desulfobacteraceae bacterium]|nr:response regulator [Desulfobacteraceae bacterium]